MLKPGVKTTNDVKKKKKGFGCLSIPKHRYGNGKEIQSNHQAIAQTQKNPNK